MIIFAVGKLDLNSQTPLTLTLTSELEVYIAVVNKYCTTDIES